ncbi:hypothetical protein P175DRAFT_0532743 [Aspergillus ochraceoroseus IBT 24754]|uniref:Uncharacterized protein n=1 Tax=Aspergillus ochraceoroseus IBT 24754 TaxID=1392256 RepID=A0A2T5LU38_9EURO|nr:uncharacterized protein P175DRAFT_0532743 [Aspergillus ochraceoroseus IBT 24754]PTU19799.1 hypothetical protein P175DRAFT_0532743 [Aspergillus ochraceoroseus IBT 24754]
METIAVLMIGLARGCPVSVGYLKVPDGKSIIRDADSDIEWSPPVADRAGYARVNKLAEAGSILYQWCAVNGNFQQSGSPNRSNAELKNPKSLELNDSAQMRLGTEGKGHVI